MSVKSEAELLFKIHLRELGVRFEREVRFCLPRKWAWDFLLPEYRIAIEIDGYFKGRHGAGWGADNEKHNTGTMMGYRVLVFSTKDVSRGKAKAFLAKHLGNCDCKEDMNKPYGGHKPDCPNAIPF